MRETQELVHFCGTHKISLRISKESMKARYRYVIDMKA